jgi:hypothetical protein
VLKLESVFSQEQIDKLISWKSFFQTEKVQAWKVIEDKAEEEIHNILETTGFAKGTNLTEANIDQIFHLMRSFSANRALSNLLYRNNTIEVFNQKLRELYFGNSPFSQKVNEFFKLDGIGMQTLSQLLVALDSRKYPLITSQTKDVLELDAQQEQKALEIALKKFEIVDSQQYLDLTLDYLADFVIFEQIKELTNLEKYTSVNNIIWFANKEDKVGPEEALEQYTSFTIEKDLKEYLAKNPHLLEKGLKMIGKEFPTKEVGNIDLLLVDNKGYDVVVELKKGRASDDVVGQISRYMGWVIKNRNKKTRGIIVVNEPDQRLDYSILPFGGSIKIKYYRVKFDLTDEYKEDKSNSVEEK